MAKSWIVHINLLFTTLLRLSCAKPIANDDPSHGASIIERSSLNEHERGQSKANPLNTRYICPSYVACSYDYSLQSYVDCPLYQSCAYDGCCYPSSALVCNPACALGYTCNYDYGVCDSDSIVTSSSTSPYYEYPTPYPSPSTTSPGFTYTPPSDNKKFSESSSTIHKKARLTSKAIGGIVGGLLAGIAALIAAIGLWWCRKRAPKNPPSSAPLYTADQSGSGYHQENKEPDIHLSPVSSPSPQPFAHNLASQPIPASTSPLDLNARPYFAPPGSENGPDHNMQPGAGQHPHLGQDHYTSQHDIQSTPGQGPQPMPDQGPYYVPIQNEQHPSGQSPSPNSPSPQIFAPTPQAPR